MEVKYLIIGLCIFVGLPTLAYLMAKFGVVGALRGKELFEENHKKKENHQHEKT